MGYIRENNQDFIPQDFWRDDLDDRPIIVTIRCIAFNQKNYIRDALDGFISQKTNFRFEAIVHDDASTDGTADIIREYAEKYPSIIKPIFEKENQYSKRNGSLSKVMNAHTRGEYVAVCEGDDYWIDPYKLQKQVDFLESHPDYGMCYTNFNILNEKKKKILKSAFENSKKYKANFLKVDDFILEEGYYCPPSWVVRTDLFQRKTIPSIDGTFVRIIDLMMCTKLYYMKDVTSVYRELEESASHSNNPNKILSRIKNLRETKREVVNKYQLDQELIEKCDVSYYRRHLFFFLREGFYDEIRDGISYYKKVSKIGIINAILYFLYKIGLRKNGFKYLFKFYKLIF